VLRSNPGVRPLFSEAFKGGHAGALSNCESQLADTIFELVAGSVSWFVTRRDMICILRFGDCLRKRRYFSAHEPPQNIVQTRDDRSSILKEHTGNPFQISVKA
jgi:hypothetical protein